MAILIRTDTPNDKKIRFDIGSHILGKEFIGTADDRIAEEHGELVITNEDIKIKPVKTCYVQHSNSNDTKILAQGEDATLRSGDKFGLLLNLYWYQVVLTNDGDSEVVKQEPDSSTTDASGPTETKRQRLDDSLEDVKPDVKPDLNALNAQIATNGCTSSSSADETASKTDILNQANGSRSPDQGTSPPTPAVAPPPVNPAPTVRERCMYGGQCYRRNPDHKRQLSHPGDPDYAQAENMACPHGAGCQRRDRRHWRDQTHPPGSKPRGKKRPRNKQDVGKVDLNNQMQPGQKRARKPTQRRASWSGSESENEYDFSDPFLTDGSDDWEPDSQMTSSDEDL